MLGKALEEDSDIVVCDLETWYGKDDSRNYIMKGMNPKYPDLPYDKRIFLSALRLEQDLPPGVLPFGRDQLRDGDLVRRP